MNVSLTLDHWCDLRCTYCYTGFKSRRPMSLDVAEKALRRAFARPEPLTRVSFFGGEPLLALDLLDTIATRARELADQAGVRVCFAVTTNGTQLATGRSEVFDVLRRHRVLVTVSIDGDEAAHDAGRRGPGGHGSFERVVAGLRLAKERLGPVRTLSVVHPGNVRRLPASFAFLRSLDVRQLAFNLDYSAHWDAESIGELDQAYVELADNAIAAFRAGEDFVLRPFHTRIVSQVKGGWPEEGRCDFGSKDLAVAPSGRIYPCDRLIGEDGPREEPLVIGHVDTGVDLHRLLALRRPKDQLKPDCEGCALDRRCVWWCGCINHAATGRTDGVEGLLCHTEQVVIREADRVATTLFAEGNTAFFSRYYLAAAKAVSAQVPLAPNVAKASVDPAP
ncbi:MAG: hypothetical protein AMXMBFR64_30160 [Myxococcales bacterium]